MKTTDAALLSRALQTTSEAEAIECLRMLRKRGVKSVSTTSTSESVAQYKAWGQHYFLLAQSLEERNRFLKKSNTLLMIFVAALLGLINVVL